MADRLKIGDHIYTRRAGFTHHGIFIGEGHAIHYRGLSHSLEAGPIEITTLDEFQSGRQARIKKPKTILYTPGQIVERAYSRLHEDSYDFETNNCEHLATWCVQGDEIPTVNGETIRAGDHLVSGRTGFTHHGIYIGNRKVIHYAGLANGFTKGDVEITTLDEFKRGQPTRIHVHKNPASAAMILWRAHLGLEKQEEYTILTNNCEHFANWCTTGEKSSRQVQRGAAVVGGFVLPRIATSALGTLSFPLGLAVAALYNKLTDD